MLYSSLIDVALLIIPILFILGFYLDYINTHFPRQGRKTLYFILGKPIKLWRSLYA